jgi:sec-independent protein translocase protein TatB
MIQGGEIVVILVLALIVLGPRRLPEVARKLGGWTAELRAAARDIRHGLEAEVAELKEASDEVRAIGQEVKKPLDDLKQPIDEVQREIRSAGAGGLGWTGPKPVSGPTPEDAMRDLEEIEKRAEGESGA